MFQWCSMYPWAHCTITDCTVHVSHIKSNAWAQLEVNVYIIVQLYIKMSIKSHNFARICCGQYSTRKDEASVIHIYLLCRLTARQTEGRALLNCSSKIIMRACQVFLGVISAIIITNQNVTRAWGLRMTYIGRVGVSGERSGWFCAFERFSKRPKT